MYDSIAPPPPALSIEERALAVQRNVNDELISIAARLGSVRSRMRVGELSPRSFAAAATAHHTTVLLGDIEQACARIRAELGAVEWGIAL